MRPRRHVVLAAVLAIALAAPTRAAVQLATLDTPGSVKDFVLDGTIGYVADAGSGVRVIDVSDPANPVEIASLPPVQLGNVQAVYLDGDRLYSAENSGGVSVIDVSTPASPVRLGRVTGMSIVLDVVASGDWAFAISNVGPGFHVIDVSNPAAPAIATSLGATGTSLRWISATRLLAGNRIVDVSDPLNPWIVAENVIYPGAIGDGFGIGAGAVRRYDLTDPESPVAVNHHLAPDDFYAAVTLDAELAWLAGASTPLALFEVSDAEPTYPLVGAFPLPSTSAGRLRVVGTRLYVTSGGTGSRGLHVYDISDPFAPALLGSYLGAFSDVDAIGDVAYVVDRFAFDDGVAGLFALDVSDPASIAEISFVPFEGGALVSASGDRVNVIDSDISSTTTLRVFDLSLPWAPAELASLALPTVVNEVASSAGRVYLTGSHQFRIYDTSAPPAIALLGQHTSTGITSGLAVAGTRAYVTSDQIEVIDFAIPFSPIVVASFDLPSASFADPVVVGSRLHVEATRPQMLTLDLSDPAEPRVVGASRIESSASLPSGAAAASGDALYFAVSGQLYVYDTAGTSGLGARRVATFPGITGAAMEFDAARDLLFLADGVLRVVDVAPDRALAECANGRDDDGDGLVDHVEDPECRDGHDRSERSDCGNGADDDGDGATDFPADPGCASAAEAAEGPDCDDGVDDDGDGFVDFGADPGCSGWSSDVEDARCQNGIDDDGDGRIDFDGGASVNGGVPLGPPDPNCTASWRAKETPASCGLGAELALASISLVLLRRRTRVRPSVRRS